MGWEKRSGRNTRDRGKKEIRKEHKRSGGKRDQEGTQEIGGKKRSGRNTRDWGKKEIRNTLPKYDIGRYHSQKNI